MPVEFKDKLLAHIDKYGFSSDTRENGGLVSERYSTSESGVALRLPPQSKVACRDFRSLLPSLRCSTPWTAPAVRERRRRFSSDRQPWVNPIKTSVLCAPIPTVRNESHLIQCSRPSRTKLTTVEDVGLSHYETGGRLARAVDGGGFVPSRHRL